MLMALHKNNKNKDGNSSKYDKCKNTKAGTNYSVMFGVTLLLLPAFVLRHVVIIFHLPVDFITVHSLN